MDCDFLRRRASNRWCTERINARKGNRIAVGQYTQNLVLCEQLRLGAEFGNGDRIARGRLRFRFYRIFFW